MKWLVAVGAVVVGLIVGLSLYLQPNDFAGCATTPSGQTPCQAADAIVVVSGGDTARRTSTGVELYTNGWAKKLIFSGAAQDTSGPSNAATMKQQALQAGVPESAIILDEAALNTQQNAANTNALFKEYKLTNIILVTSGYHQRRASLEFHKQSPDSIIRNHPAASDKDWNGWWWLTPRGWWLAGGEMIKIIAFFVGVSS